MSLKKKILLEGTWGQGYGKKESVSKAIKELEIWKDKWYHDLGDDTIYDGIDSAIRELKELHKDRMDHPQNWKH